MIDALAMALLVVGVPVGLFLAGGVWMMKATGRAAFRQRRSQPNSEPLNFRVRGYDLGAASAYWEWLGPAGRAAEQRFLKADMAFPAWYGALLLGGSYLAWVQLGRPFSALGLVAPAAIAMLADWVENLVHLQQIARFPSGLDARMIRIASMATSTKLASFWVATLLLVALGAWLPVRALGQAG